MARAPAAMAKEWVEPSGFLSARGSEGEPILLLAERFKEARIGRRSTGEEQAKAGQRDCRYSCTLYQDIYLFFGTRQRIASKCFIGTETDMRSGTSGYREVRLSFRQGLQPELRLTRRHFQCF